MNEHGHDGELCKGRGGSPDCIEGASYAREAVKGPCYGIELESLSVEGLDGGDGGDSVVDLSGSSGSSRTIRSKQGGDEYLGEELYDGEERNGGENDKSERP